MFGVVKALMVMTLHIKNIAESLKKIIKLTLIIRKLLFRIHHMTTFSVENANSQ